MEHHNAKIEALKLALEYAHHSNRFFGHGEITKIAEHFYEFITNRQK